MEALAVAGAGKTAIFAHAILILFIETVGIHPTNGGIENSQLDQPAFLAKRPLAGHQYDQ